MGTLVQDLRYALRQLGKNPGFTAIAVLTLALGIAVNATMFSMVSAFLLRRPPGRDPDHIAVVTGIDRRYPSSCNVGHVFSSASFGTSRAHECLAPGIAPEHRQSLTEQDLLRPLIASLLNPQIAIVARSGDSAA